MIVALHLRRLLEQPLRTAVALVAIAAGVALTGGVLIGHASLLHSIDEFGTTIGGPARFRVTGPIDQAGVSLADVEAMGEVPGVAVAVPLVLATTTAVSADGDSRFVSVVGADCARFPLCADPHRMTLSRELADELGPGAVVHTNAGSLAVDEAVTSLRLDGPAAGRVLVLPLDQARHRFVRGEWVDATYVVLTEDADPDAVRAALERVAPDVVVKDADASIVDSEIIGQLLVGLLLTSLIGLTIGGQLVGNTLTLSFEERRRELAVVAAVGATPRRLARGIVVEAVVLGGVGGLAGAALGLLVAQASIGPVSNQIERASGIAIELHVPLVMVAASVVIGMVVAVLAAIGPCRRVARLDLAGELADRDRHEPGGARHPWLAAVVVASGAVGLALAYLGGRDGSLARWQPVAAVAGLVLSAACSFRIAGLVAVPAVARLASIKRFTGTVRVALGGLAGDAKRTASVTAAIAGAVALGATLTGIAPALQRGGEGFARDTADGRVLVTTMPVNNAAGLDAKLSVEEEATLARVPGVGHLEHHLYETLNHPSIGYVELVGVDVPSAFDTFRGPAPATTFAAGRVLVGPALARSEGLQPGDTLVVPGRAGPVSLVVGTVWAAPAGLGRSITMPIEAFERIAGPRRPSTVLVVAEPGVDPDELATTIEGAGIRDELRAFGPTALGEEFGGEFRLFTAPFEALQRALLLVTFAATMSTLLLTGIQRRREHALLSAVGLAPRRLATVTLVEVAVLGAIASVSGAISGAVTAATFGSASGVLTGLRIHIGWSPLGTLTVGALATGVALVGAAYPAWRTSRIDPALALRYE